MKQVVLQSPKTMLCTEADESKQLGPNDVCIMVKAVTICGSDVSYFKRDILPHHLQYPLVLGHEMAGIVKAVGTSVTHIRPGNRVAIEPQIACGHCPACLRGNYNFCESVKFMASKGMQGALKEEVIWPKERVFHLPDSMSMEEGALLEPLSVAYSALEKLVFHEQDTLVILGAGSIGLFMAVLMHLLYPMVKVNLVDLYENKRDMGLKMQLQKEQFLIGNDYDMQRLPKFTHVIDTTGNAKLVHKFLQHSICGVTLLAIGISNQKLEMDFQDIVYQGIHIIGSYRYTNTYPKLIELFKQGLDVKAIITDRYPLVQAQQAFVQAMDGSHHGKIAILL